MSEIPSAGEFLQQLKADEQQSIFKLGLVKELFSNGKAKVIFDGEDKASEKIYPALSSYAPAINDRVLLASISGTYVILGKIVR